MVKKNKLTYICRSCLNSYSDWSGRCPNCLEWNSLEEQNINLNTNLDPTKVGVPLKGEKLVARDGDDLKRYEVGFPDINQLLGGGLVSGSVNLITGEPGIGKSTLLLQLATYVATYKAVLYVSGEESVSQVSQRAKRLGFSNVNLVIVNSYSTDDIVASILTSKYDLVIVDSIQTISTSLLNSSAGSVGQISTSTQNIIMAAKSSNTAVLLVGHVTKEGNIAGPKLLEHMVDVVLRLEGDRFGGFKLLKAVKNRFGSTHEVAIFEMNETGFKVIKNPSAVLLEERLNTDGSIVTATMEGSRPILVEVQALVSTSNFGYPKRTASGFDINRLNLLIAVLEQRTKLKLSDKDVYINVVGGISLTEPSADLAVCLAIASALLARKLSSNLVVFGEIGLSGEVRHVYFIDKRLKEASQLGFDGAIGPKLNGKNLKNLNIVSSLSQAIKLFV